MARTINQSRWRYSPCVHWFIVLARWLGFHCRGFPLCLDPACPRWDPRSIPAVHCSQRSSPCFLMTHVCRSRGALPFICLRRWGALSRCRGNPQVSSPMKISAIGGLRPLAHRASPWVQTTPRPHPNCCSLPLGLTSRASPSAPLVAPARCHCVSPFMGGVACCWFVSC